MVLIAPVPGHCFPFIFQFEQKKVGSVNGIIFNNNVAV